jgi:acetyltransferase-like isoleucine patch superfamily enzyme
MKISTTSVIRKTAFCIGYIVNLIEKSRQVYLADRKCVKGNGRLGPNVMISNAQNIYIGNNSYVNSGMLYASKNASITIGDNCLLSYNVHLRTDTHIFKSKSTTILSQGHSEKNISIEDDCWIGYGVQIMPGVTVKKGCVIGAGAVLTKDTEEYGVYVGIPAHRIFNRE